jgi:hypothetical protein
VTPFHHQPEAQHPKIFQLSTSRRPITPSLGTAGTTASNLRRVYRCHTINFDLVIKTAKGTGLDVPSFIRLRGDEVIE